MMRLMSEGAYVLETYIPALSIIISCAYLLSTGHALIISNNIMSESQTSFTIQYSQNNMIFNDSCSHKILAEVGFEPTSA